MKNDTSMYRTIWEAEGGQKENVLPYVDWVSNTFGGACTNIYIPGVNKACENVLDPLCVSPLSTKNLSNGGNGGGGGGEGYTN